MNGRERILNALAMKATDRPPVWFMRQAGRSLPEYVKLRDRHGFHGLMSDPELAAEVTIQPITRFGFDAAIIFSDILVVPAAMGQAFVFAEGKGIRMEFAVRSRADVNRLNVEAIDEKLAYLFEALRITRRRLGMETALLGFAGSPWSLATFMVEGGSAKEYGAAHAMRKSEPAVFAALMEKLASAVARSLKAQIAAGADAVQIFDSFADGIPSAEYHEASGRWIRAVIDEVGDIAPVILFRKGLIDDPARLLDTGARALSVDSRVDLAEVRKHLPDTPLQGNLDPALLLGEPEAAVKETGRILASMKGEPGYIFNLGHGVLPGSRLETIQAVLKRCRS